MYRTGCDKFTAHGGIIHPHHRAGHVYQSAFGVLDIKASAFGDMLPARSQRLPLVAERDWRG